MDGVAVQEAVQVQAEKTSEESENPKNADGKKVQRCCWSQQSVWDPVLFFIFKASGNQHKHHDITKCPFLATATASIKH